MPVKDQVGFSAILPGKVSVRFRTRCCSGTTSPPDAWTVEVDTPAAASLPSLGGSPATTVVEDSAFAIFNGGSTPVNSSTLTDLANAIAAELCLWRENQGDHVFAGIVAPEMNAQNDEVEWQIDDDGCRTTFSSGPFVQEADRLMHHDPTGWCEVPCDAIELYGADMAIVGQNVRIPTYSAWLDDDYSPPRIRTKRKSQTDIRACCGQRAFAFVVRGCWEDPLPGATVSVTGPGGFSGTYTTDASGSVTVNINAYPDGLYTAVVNKPRFQQGTVSFLYPGGGPINNGRVKLLPLSGYYCSCCRWQVIPPQLQMTVSWGPSVTLTVVSSPGALTTEGVTYKGFAEYQGRPYEFGLSVGATSPGAPNGACGVGYRDMADSSIFQLGTYSDFAIIDSLEPFIAHAAIFPVPYTFPKQPGTALVVEL